MTIKKLKELVANLDDNQKVEVFTDRDNMPKERIMLDGMHWIVVGYEVGSPSFIVEDINKVK